MEITELEFSGIVPSLQAMRLPKGGAHKSSSVTTDTDNRETDTAYTHSEAFTATIAKADIELAGRLVKAGNEHAKAVRGILVYVRITARYTGGAKWKHTGLGASGCPVKALCTLTARTYRARSCNRQRLQYLWARNKRLWISTATSVCATSTSSASTTVCPNGGSSASGWKACHLQPSL